MIESKIIFMPEQHDKRHNKKRKSEWEKKREERARGILKTMDELQAAVTAAGKPRLLADFLSDLGLYSITLWRLSEERKGGAL